MRFAQWMDSHEVIRARKLGAGEQAAGLSLIAGQDNYVLESIMGDGAAAQVTGIFGPFTKAQLENLRDHLLAAFPPPQA